MNDLNKKLPLYKDRKITEENTTPISDEELDKKIKYYHSECVKWCKKVEEWLNENK
jgi:hypothetical protein